MTLETSGTDRILIWQNGNIVFDFKTSRSSSPIELMSVTKSMAAIATCQLVDLRLLSTLDVPIHSIYPEWKQGLKKQITVRHILNHTSTLQAARTTEEIYDSPDFVQPALCAELSGNPGSKFFYNNKAVNLLSGIVEKLSGLRLDQFFERHLFAALKISEYEWELDPAGHAQAFAGLSLLGEDLLKIGLLMLNRGHWNNKKILSPLLVDEMIKPGQTLNEVCGLLWWRFSYKVEADGEEFFGYKATGYLGQALVVIPKHSLVAVRQVHSQTAKDTNFAELPELDSLLLRALELMNR